MMMRIPFLPAAAVAALPLGLPAGSVTFSSSADSNPVFPSGTTVKIWHVEVTDPPAGVTVSWGDGTVSTGVHPPFTHTLAADTHELVISGVSALDKGFCAEDGTARAEQRWNETDWRPVGPCADTVTFSGVRRLGRQALLGVAAAGQMTSQYLTLDLGDMEELDTLAVPVTRIRSIAIPATLTRLGLYSLPVGQSSGSSQPTCTVAAANPVYADYGANIVVHKATGILVHAMRGAAYSNKVRGILYHQIGAGSSAYRSTTPYLSIGHFGRPANGERGADFAIDMNGIIRSDREVFGRISRGSCRNDDVGFGEPWLPYTVAQVRSANGFPWFFVRRTIHCTDGDIVVP